MQYLEIHYFYHGDFKSLLFFKSEMLSKERQIQHYACLFYIERLDENQILSLLIWIYVSLSHNLYYWISLEEANDQLMKWMVPRISNACIFLWPQQHPKVLSLLLSTFFASLQSPCCIETSTFCRILNWGQYCSNAIIWRIHCQFKLLV